MQTEYILAAIIAWLILCIILQNREHRKLIEKILGIKPVERGKQAIVEEDASPKEEESKGWYDH